MRRFIVLAVVIAAGVGGYFYWQESQHWESTDDAQIDSRIHEVSARVAGTVVSIKVEDNQFVEAGAVLAELDTRPYEVAVEQAKAAIAQAQADVLAVRSDLPVVTTTTTSQLSAARGSVEEVNAAIATAEQQLTATRAQLPVAEARMRHAEADSVKAQNDLNRYQTLVAKEEISRQTFDGARGQAAAMKAELDAAQASLEEVKRAIQVAEARVAQEKSRLARAQSEVQSAASGPQQLAAIQARAQAAAARVATEKARLEQAELNLEYAVVKAPVSGVVRRNVEIGQAVAAGQPVVTVVPLNEVWVSAHFKENQLAQIQVGQPVDVAVDAFGGKIYKGKVDSIAAATGARFSLLPPDNATGNFVKVVQRLTVKIVLEPTEDPQHQLRPGMSVVPKVRVR